MVEPAHDEKESEKSTSNVDSSLKIEQLLLSGLDHYFKRRYERAIDIWTRVLFLDRSHARARAYIDRARGAVAERLRESEELVHTGIEALERGDVPEARNLLRSAVEHGGGRDDVQSILERLEHLDHLDAASGTSVAPRSEVSPVLAESTLATETLEPIPRRLRLGPLGALVALFAVIGYLAVSGIEWSPWLQNQTVPTAPVVIVRARILIPAISELDVQRARRLVEDGRLRDALALLEGITPIDPVAAEAGRLRAQIQRELLEPLSAGGLVR